MKQTLGDILQNYREQNKLTFRELQERIGVSYSYLHKIVHGEAQPSKEKVQLIADELELSRYRLLLAAGYYVDLNKDLKIKDLNWGYSELIDNLMRYRIYALPHLSQLINDNQISVSHLSQLSKIEINKLSEIITMNDKSTFDEAKDICFALNTKFYEVFEVRKVNYDVKFIGMRADEDIAFQTYKHIETLRYQYFARIGLPEVAATQEVRSEIRSEQLLSHGSIGATIGELVAGSFGAVLGASAGRAMNIVKESLNRYDGKQFEIKLDKLTNEIKTIDELEYVMGCLDVYKKMKSKYLIKE